MINKVKKIIIFGGGTSGWLTAAYLTKNLEIPVEVTLIEDTTLGPIGVGEGTQPLTASFLHHCGLDPKLWMGPSKGAFKLGVELDGWTDKPYFVDNDGLDSSYIAENFYACHYFANKPHQEFLDFHPAYQLAKENVSPKLGGFDQTFGVGPEGFGAVHFSAYAILDSIKALILDRITYVDTRITEVKQDMYGITKLIDDKNKEYYADLFIDCSGFASILLEKTLKSPFTSYSDWLPNDRAVVIPTQFKDPVAECHPYTKATAMNAGWKFTIPTYERIGNGYVYSSKFITDEEAEKELRDNLGEYDTPAKFLKMKCGYHKEIAVKNVCAVGLSGGFVEPLEATGITFTTATVRSLCDLLNINRNVWNQQVRTNINRGFYEMSIEILTFVWAHYHFSIKNDTPFWQHIRNQKITDLPADAQWILSHFYPKMGNFMFFSRASMFNITQWFSMLHAGGAYKDSDVSLTPEQEAYGKYFVATQTARIEAAKQMFPKHYDYLKQWYGQS